MFYVLIHERDIRSFEDYLSARRCAQELDGRFIAAENGDGEDFSPVNSAPQENYKTPVREMSNDEFFRFILEHRTHLRGVRVT